MPTLESVTGPFWEYAGKSLDEESKECLVDNHFTDLSHFLLEEDEE